MTRPHAGARGAQRKDKVSRLGAGTQRKKRPHLTLQLRGLKFATKVPVPLIYKGLEIPRAYEADFIVERCLVVELKAVEILPKVVKRQMRTYLRLLGCPLGLILNFGGETMKQGIHRIVNNFPFGTPPYAPADVVIVGRQDDPDTPEG